MRFRWPLKRKRSRPESVFFTGFVSALLNGNQPFEDGMTAILLSGEAKPSAACDTLQQVFDVVPEYDGEGYQRQVVSGVRLMRTSLFIDPIEFGAISGGAVNGLLLAMGEMPLLYLFGPTFQHRPKGGTFTIDYRGQPVFSWSYD